MKIRLVFDDWRKNGKSIYETEEGIELILGDFHSGSIFDGEINLDEGDSKELQKALDSGFTPVFYVL